MNAASSRLPRWASRVTAAAAIGAFLPAALAGVSPGPLARAHEKLDSLTQCTACHRPGASSTRDECLACHREISWLIAQGRGLHAKPQRSCEECHAEHKGRDAALVRFEEGQPERFDHGKTGWNLEGKHAKVKCRDCHKPANQRSEAIRIAKRVDHAASFLGLEHACAACHEDKHRNTPNKDCARCHAPAGFRPALAFDHGKTRFPLTGSHARVACFKCHRDGSQKVPATAALPAALAASATPAASAVPAVSAGANASAAGAAPAASAPPPAPVFGPLPHDDCSACHADQHAGRLGAACARCHNTEGFRHVDRKAFDHGRTRFPLVGRHLTVECARCHDPAAPPGTKPQFATCTSCHRDPHGGKATLAGQKADCAACHVVDGFRPSTFTVARHEASPFPLQGRHVQVKCEGCHTADPARGTGASLLRDAGILLRPPHARCGSCHQDAHGGQLKDRADGGECGSCHKVDGFKPSTFTAKDHANLRVDLSGKHATLECAACHSPTRKGLPPPIPAEAMGKAKVALALGAGACASCHASPHGNQFASRRDGGACGSCHDTSAFRPPSRFDHGRETRFPLLRAHSRTPCARCHEPKIDASGKPVTVFRAVAISCKDCHLALKVVLRSEGSLGPLG